jgi:hypothetical protein
VPLSHQPRPCIILCFFLRVTHQLPPNRRPILTIPMCLLLPLSLDISIPRVQTQEITVRGNDLYTPHFKLPTNFSPTHQPTYFCLISRNAYILTQNLNPENAYIEGQTKYYTSTATSPHWQIHGVIFFKKRRDGSWSMHSPFGAKILLRRQSMMTCNCKC